MISKPSGVTQYKNTKWSEHNIRNDCGPCYVCMYVCMYVWKFISGTP